jgi:phosphatidylinositol alpha-mannosyltransferase
MAALIHAEAPLVATFHAAGNVPLYALAKPVFGFLLDRLDARVAVSLQARETAARLFPGEYQVIPNGAPFPRRASSGNRRNTITFVGRHDRRKGLAVLLRAWPDMQRQTGARLRIIGADPRAVGALLGRLRIDRSSIDLLGCIGDAALTEELLATRVLVAPSLGNESFGMVITRAFACATPVVASDIAGYRDVVTRETGVLVAPGESHALADAVVGLLANERLRTQFGAEARELARTEYSWERIALRLCSIYDGLVTRPTKEKELVAA